MSRRVYQASTKQEFTLHCVIKTSNGFREGSLAGGRRDKGIRWSGAAIPVVVLFLAVVTHAQSASEDQVKAAFLFNFAKFVEWPADAYTRANAPLQVCVLGQDSFGPGFEHVIAGKEVNGHRLEVVRLSAPSQARACQILFVAASEGPRMREILRCVKGASVLTVGETAGFARAGGIINFVLDDGRVRFEINLEAAEQAHLRLSARLLTLAKLIVANEETDTR